MNIRILNRGSAWKVAGKQGILRRMGIKRKMRRDININNIKRDIKKDKKDKKGKKGKKDKKVNGDKR